MKKEKIEKFYSVYRIELKEGSEELNNENIHDLVNVGVCDTLQDVAELLNYNTSYIKSRKTIKKSYTTYKLIDDKYIIYFDDTSDVIF